MTKQRVGSNDLIKIFGKPEDEPFPVVSIPIATIHEVVVDEEFTSVRQFMALVQTLQNAGPEDGVKILLTTPGGSLAAILPLLSAMNNTEAHVHVEVISDVASAGTFLMMLADTVSINPYSTIMFHNVSYGVAGHAGNVQATVKHYERMNDGLLSEMYKDFLTEDELKHLKDGLEIYLGPEECYDRFQKRAEARKAYLEKVSQEAIKAIEDAAKPVVRKPRAKRKTAEVVAEQ